MNTVPCQAGVDLHAVEVLFGRSLQTFVSYVVLDTRDYMYMKANKSSVTSHRTGISYVGGITMKITCEGIMHGDNSLFKYTCIS